MNVLLRWKMPRAYKIDLTRRISKILLRWLAITTFIVFVGSQIALNSLAHLDAREATRTASTVYLILVLSPLIFLPIFVRLIFPVYYALTPDELKKEGDRVCQWQDVESYEFEMSEVGTSVRILKINIKGYEGSYSWPFDPTDVEEERIAQIFEEQMARHRRELLEN